MATGEYPDPLPPQCVLDRSRIENIEATVNKISNQLDGLMSMEGPISRIQQRLAIVEGATDRAHQRIDHSDNIVETLKKSHTSLVLKVGVIMAPIAAAVGALIAELLK